MDVEAMEPCKDRVVENISGRQPDLSWSHFLLLNDGGLREASNVTNFNFKPMSPTRPNPIQGAEHSSGWRHMRRTCLLVSEFSLQYSVFNFQYTGCHLPGWEARFEILSSGSHFLSEGVWVMTNHEAYRKKALQCLRAAGKVHDSGERAALLSLASNYLTLADYVGGRRNDLTEPGGDRDHES